MDKFGFTLIELMITIVIVATLAAIALPAYNYYVKRSREVEATTALSDIRAAQLVYKQDIRQGNGHFASDLTALGWKLDSTGTTIGKAPASFTYSTNTTYSGATTPHTDVVNHPQMYMSHSDPTIVFTPPTNPQ